MTEMEYSIIILRYMSSLRQYHTVGSAAVQNISMATAIKI